ncbi:nuclear transport factor 2 family protein [Streptomyces sp. NBC_00582]|uniref:nuclear transport factor 2 family protein n=1 Tax=Streptomyces sp. NBC_00582 TaxID=2975783 RepID=UPI002E80E2AC|nr:nuclear transport factor 2 family protein [Streptomyces sp. NBC_00582]WUB67476.1 nuclear transport factor 2 family protein [Streptomyces sp. NBC_00582]
MSAVPTPATVAAKRLVVDFFTAVIAARNVDAIPDYVAPELIQHGADIPDGVQAYTEHLRDRFRREARAEDADGVRQPPEPVFIIADNDLVCVCRYLPQPDPDVPGATFDYYTFTTYRVRDGRITERWPSVNKVALPQPPAPDTPSRAVLVSTPPGNDMEANKRLVTDFYRCIFDARNPDAVKDFVTEDYHQYVAHYPTGRAGLEKFVRIQFPDGPVPTPAEPLNPPALLLAQGDIVVCAGLLPQPDPDGGTYPYYVYDAFRVRDGLLSEHWSGVTKAALPRHPGPPPRGHS